MRDTIYDVIIIGGSYAGLSAALQLARARRRVLIIDEGLRRNRSASHSHGFITQDGVDPPHRSPGAGPGDGLCDGGLAGRSSRWRTAGQEPGAGKPTYRSDGWRLASRFAPADPGSRRHRLLPEIEGLKERWGRHVFHCPYCHGYELNQGSIGVIAGSELSLHQALMLPDWGPTTLLLNQAFDPRADQLAALAARGVAVERSLVKSIRGDADVELADGRTLSFSGLFALAPFKTTTSLPQQLGLDFDETPLGSIIRTDAMKETSLAGVFACGDAVRATASVALAVADGNLAGVAAHRSLMSGGIAHG